MKILIAGAGGYIGARLLRRLGPLPGYEARGIVRSVPGGAGIDIAHDRAALHALFESFRPEAVINAAGTISPDMRRCLSAHVDVTAALIEAAATFAPGARFIQLGSAAEYGDAAHEPDALHEAMLPRPQGAYGISKLAGTLLATREAPTRGLHAVSLRIFNLVGRDMTPGTIFANVQRFLAEPGRRSTDPLPVGSLDIHRDFVHIDDVIDAVHAALRASPERLPNGSIINVASGQVVQVRRVVRELLDLAGHTGPLEERAPNSGRSQGVRWALGDTRLAREYLGWQARRPLSEALRELTP